VSFDVSMYMKFLNEEGGGFRFYIERASSSAVSVQIRLLGRKSRMEALYW